MGWYLAMVLYLIGALFVFAECYGMRFDDDIPGNEPRIRRSLVVMMLFWPILAVWHVAVTAVTARD